jgi:hypothetical protein
MYKNNSSQPSLNTFFRPKGTCEQVLWKYPKAIEKPSEHDWYKSRRYSQVTPAA